MQLHQVDVALAALDNVADFTFEATEQIDFSTEPKSRRILTRSIGLTLKDMIIMVLSVRDGSADARTILDAINDRWHLELPRTSLSPQLSRLKYEGKLTLAGKVWRIAGLEPAGVADTPAPRRDGPSG